MVGPFAAQTDTGSVRKPDATMARRHGRLGYRKIAEMLRSTAGWIVNDKRVERIWRREGLKVPAKQSKQGRMSRPSRVASMRATARRSLPQEPAL